MSSEVQWAVSAYVNTNIPIRPLQTDGFPDTTNLFTPEEKVSLLAKLTEAQRKIVTDNGTAFHPLKLLNFQIPREFWTPERIERQAWHGIGLSAGLTAIPAKDSSKVLLNVLFDIDNNPDKNDSSIPVQIAQKLLVELGLEGRTIVQKTPNNGMHVAVAVPVDPNDLKTISMWEERGFQEGYCINNCRVAIKIKYMQISLEPTPHRDGSGRKYQLVHRNFV